MMLRARLDYVDTSKIFQNMIISLLILFSYLDQTLATSVKRSTDGEPYGIKPPEYPFEPHPASLSEHLVYSNRPIICNNKTEFECVCMKPYISSHSSLSKINQSSSLINSISDCSIFIKTDELPVVDMRMKNVNTEALLYTGISYEEYFKKRISSIVSQYCQHNTNECPGTTLRMSQVSQENVVILRMDHLKGSITRILFVLTKHDRTGGIVNENMIIDPVKVKYIIASQISPLSRVLGGIKIDSVRAAKMKRNSDVAISSFATPQQIADNMRDNSRLIKGILIVLTFFMITYCIAAIRCIRYLWRKRQAKREASIAEAGLASTTECKNYGTCEKPRKPSRNGHIHMEERVPLTYEQIDESANNEPKSLTERQVRNWFMCDSSQLPREPTFDATTSIDEPIQIIKNSTPNPTNDLKQKHESPILTNQETEPIEQNHNVYQESYEPQEKTNSTEIFPPTTDFTNYVENQFNGNGTSPTNPDQNLTKLPLEDPWDEYPTSVAAPILLLQSETPDIPNVNPIINDKENIDDDADTPLKSRLGSDSPQFSRPRSRRGSRIDEEDEILDLPELKPLHSDDPLKEPLDVPVPIERIKNTVDEEDRWSSSEEGEVDIYYKMSDDEDVTQEELEWKKSMTKAELEQKAENQEQQLPVSSSIKKKKSVPKKNETPPSSPTQPNHINESDSEDEDVIMAKQKRNEEDGEDDAFVYERLREELSPHPPIVVDLDPIKALPPLPQGIFPDSPPESGSDKFHTQRSQEISNSSDDEDSLR